MKNFVAFIKSNVHGGITVMRHSEYSTKKDFSHDLKANGYTVYAILTEKQIEEIKNRDELQVKEIIELMCKYNRKHKDFIEYVDQCL